MGLFNTQLAYEVWRTKYKYGDETPLQTFQRVAKALASVEVEDVRDYWYTQFLNVLVKFDEQDREIGIKASPGGRITANAGTSYAKTTLMNCFIDSPPKSAKIEYDAIIPGIDEPQKRVIITEDTPDSLANIMLALLQQAETLKSEGGGNVQRSGNY